MKEQINYLSNIWKMYVVQALLAIELTMAIYVLFLLDLGLSMTEIMFLEIVFMFIIVLLEVPSGAFADIFGRKTALVIAILALPIGFIMVGMAQGLFLLLIAQLAIAIAWSFSSGADEALVYDSLKAHHKEKNFKKILGRLNFSRHITWTIVSVISGLLATYLAYRNLFFLTAGFYSLAIIFILGLKEPPRKKLVVEKHYWQHLKEALRFTIRHANVRFYILYFSLFGAITHLTWFLLQPYYLDKGSSVFFIGVVIAIYFGTYAFGTLLADKFTKYLDEYKLLFIAIFLSALSFIALYFTSAVLGVIIVGLMSFVCGIREIFVSDGINKHTDSHHRATVISVKNQAKGVMYILFAFIIGRATDAYSPNFSFLLMGIGLLVFTILLFSGRYLREAKAQTK